MFRSPIILIVDDELRMCESLSYLLKSKDYEISSANSGKEALALLGEKVFDLAILDVHLPDMLGHEILSHIRSHSPDTLVIVITGDADLDSAITALKCGAYDYLRKPFEFEEFLKTVENAINQRLLKEEKDTISKKLILSEKKYRCLVENSPDLIYTLDSNGNFTFLSEAAERLLGFKPEELIGKHYSTIVCKEDREKANRFFDERRSRERISSGIELRLKLKENVSPNFREILCITVELKSMGICEASQHDGKKRHVGTQGVIRDITERKRFQTQIQNAQRMESIGTLAGGIAHDFNNLLMGIQGRSTLISMDLDDSHPHMEHLNSIFEYIRSATDLTRQLLGFARGGKYEVKPTDINALVLKSVNMFGRTKKEITIRTNFHNSKIIVESDQNQIEQVLINLFVNAWQAMPKGGELCLETDIVLLDNVFCKTHRVDPGSYAHVSVTDTGIGIAKEILQQIFDPFFTTKQKGRGAGLGLASAYGIIKNHAGIITVSSEIEHGTTFNIYLPISEKMLSNSSPALTEKIAKGSEMLLLVDDEDMIIEVGKELLMKLGYRVISVKSGEEAVGVAKRMGSEIDLVILDMIMPGMDGGRTFDRIREIHPKLPVILCSGYAIDGQAQEILARGCNGFIQKPFSIYELSQKIQKLLDGFNG